ncbi:winged helix-turn-helix domain-containing protein [Streptomyces sp. NPDC002685]|uniref:helix-turn-helix domain-containing protein n=1 Tax=Streptomyces sp. NPDC002685 TaxID=3154540 RepID=UPI0033340AD9
MRRHRPICHSTWATPLEDLDRRVEPRHGQPSAPPDGARQRGNQLAGPATGATRLMHRLGFSPQIPARRVAERDETVVTSWKEATWAEVKGPGRSAGATSASRTRRASHVGRSKDAPGAGAAAPRL